MISAKQCRAARELLDWNQEDLARESDVGLSTISGFEKKSPDKAPVRADSINKLHKTFERFDIIFLDGDGVKRGTKRLKFYDNSNCCDILFEDMQKEAKENGCEIIASISSLDILTRYSSDPRRNNLERLTELHRITGVKFVLPDNCSPSFALPSFAIRLAPQNLIWNTSFFIYGGKLAFVFTDSDFRVAIFHIANFSDDYEKMFMSAWNMGKAIQTKTSRVNAGHSLEVAVAL